MSHSDQYWTTTDKPDLFEQDRMNWLSNTSVPDGCLAITIGHSFMIGPAPITISEEGLTFRKPPIGYCVGAPPDNKIARYYEIVCMQTDAEMGEHCVDVLTGDTRGE